MLGLVMSYSLRPYGSCLPGSSVHGDSPGKNIGVGCHSLLQRIFPTQGSNSGLPDCKQILYCLSHQGSPSILEWVAYPFTAGSSQPRNWTRVACIWSGFFTIWICVCVFALSRWFSGKESANTGRRSLRRRQFDPWVGKIPPSREWLSTPVFLPGKSHGKRSLAGYSPWGHKELDSTHAHLHITCAHPPAALTSSLDYL